MFAEQQFIDCSHETGNNGCNGGLLIGAWQYAEKHAIALEKDYPYQETDRGTTCQDNIIPGLAKLSDFKFVTPSNAEATKEAVRQQPQSIGIQANRVPFQAYSGGVLNSDRCGGDNLDHAVLIIGWGVDAEAGEYMTIKNQWGTGWGEDGFMRISIGPDSPAGGYCGFLKEVSHPIIA